MRRVRLEDPVGEVGIETHLLAAGSVVHQVPMTYRGAPLDGAALIATAEHSLLGTRWIYDAETDPVWRGQLLELVRTGRRAEATKRAPGPTEARGQLVRAWDDDSSVAIDLVRVLMPGPPPEGPDVLGVVTGRTGRRCPTGTCGRCLGYLRPCPSADRRRTFERERGPLPVSKARLSAAGRRRTAMSVTYSVHVEAPVEKVFDWFKDPRNWPQLAPEQSVQQTEVHVTREGLGTFYVWSTKLLGVRAEGFGVFTEFIPNKLIVDKQSWAFEGTWTYTFDPEGSGTRLTMRRHPRSFWRLRPFDWLWYRVEGRMWEESERKLQEILQPTGAQAKATG